MTSNSLTPIINSITALLSTAAGRPILIALDGRCGSGKTTLAAQLAERFPGSRTIHTDDYYLPPAPAGAGVGNTPLRQHGFKAPAGRGAEPRPAGQPFSYLAYSCREGAYLPPVSCQPARLVIVEGSYSHHPALADCYDLRVFVTCSKAEQTRRLQAREGARYPAFAQRWIPLEEGYFAKYSIEESADLILDPEKGMIEATKL